MKPKQMTKSQNERLPNHLDITLSTQLPPLSPALSTQTPDPTAPSLSLSRRRPRTVPFASCPFHTNNAGVLLVFWCCAVGKLLCSLKSATG